MYLKEVEYRYNHRQDNLFQTIAHYLVTFPSNYQNNRTQMIQRYVTQPKPLIVLLRR